MADIKTGDGTCSGKITQIISAVLDIKFTDGRLPEINEAIKIPLKEGNPLIVEVAQHLGDDTVRCIAMGSTDGLVRGMEAIATGGAYQRSGWREYPWTYVQRIGRAD